jgi:hypothetical protein
MRDNRFRRLLLGSCSGLALAFAAGHAEAVSITVGYTYTVNGGSLQSDSQVSSSFVDLTPYEEDGNGNGIFGHDYGYEQGWFGTRSSGTGNFTKTGSSLWSDTITNTWGAPTAITVNFLVDNGEVGVSMPNTPGSYSAGVAAEIKVDGNVLFSSTADMSITDGGMPTFNTTGTVLNPGGESLSEGSGSYSWAPYSGSIFLGLLDVDESFTVEYLLTSYANGSLPDCGTGGGGYGYGYGYGPTDSGVSCYLGQSVGRIGDPLNIETNGPNQFDVATPEPASAAMLGAGLAALAFRRRRRA